MTLVYKMILNAHSKFVIATWIKVARGSKTQGWCLHVKESSKHKTLFCGVKQSSDFGVWKSKLW